MCCLCTALVANVTVFQPDDESGDISSDLARQQQLMIQLLQLSQQSQNKLAQRQQQHQQKIEDLEEAVAQTRSELRKQQNSYSLITVNMLDTMMNAEWSEPEKNKVGVQLSKFSRLHHVQPTKVPHPSLPNGVNAYEPGIVKAWLEENGYPVPGDLRYVD